MEINELPPSAVSALANEALDPSSFENEERRNNGPSTSGFDGFICNIENNNNNIGTRDGDSVGTDQCGEAIKSCFQQYLEGNDFEEWSSRDHCRRSLGPSHIAFNYLQCRLA